MAFELSGFSPDGRANGVRIHTYSSEDAIAEVNTSGYFNDLSDVLNVLAAIVTGKPDNSKAMIIPPRHI